MLPLRKNQLPGMASPGTSPAIATPTPAPRAPIAGGPGNTAMRQGMPNTGALPGMAGSAGMKANGITMGRGQFVPGTQGTSGGRPMPTQQTFTQNTGRGPGAVPGQQPPQGGVQQPSGYGMRSAPGQTGTAPGLAYQGGASRPGSVRGGGTDFLTGLAAANGVDIRPKTGFVTPPRSGAGTNVVVGQMPSAATGGTGYRPPGGTRPPRSGGNPMTQGWKPLSSGGGGTTQQRPPSGMVDGVVAPLAGQVTAKPTPTNPSDPSWLTNANATAEATAEAQANPSGPSFPMPTKPPDMLKPPSTPAPGEMNQYDPNAPTGTGVIDSPYPGAGGTNTNTGNIFEQPLYSGAPNSPSLLGGPLRGVARAPDPTGAFVGEEYGSSSGYGQVSEVDNPYGDPFGEGGSGYTGLDPAVTPTTPGSGGTTPVRPAGTGDADVLPDTYTPPPIVNSGGTSNGYGSPGSLGGGGGYQGGSPPTGSGLGVGQGGGNYGGSGQSGSGTVTGGSGGDYGWSGGMDDFGGPYPSPGGGPYTQPNMPPSPGTQPAPAPSPQPSPGSPPPPSPSPQSPPPSPQPAPSYPPAPAPQQPPPWTYQPPQNVGTEGYSLSDSQSGGTDTSHSESQGTQSSQNQSTSSGTSQSTNQSQSGGTSFSDAKQTWDLTKAADLLGAFLSREQTAANPYTRQQFDEERNRQNSQIAQGSQSQLDELMARAKAQGMDVNSPAILAARERILSGRNAAEVANTSKLDAAFRQQSGAFDQQNAAQNIGQRGQDVTQRGQVESLIRTLLGQQVSGSQNQSTSLGQSTSQNQGQSTGSSQGQQTSFSDSNGQRWSWSHSESRWVPVFGI